MPRDVIDVIDDRVRRAGYQPWKGLVVFVGPSKALVVRDGTTTPVPCSYSLQDGVAVGKRCVVDWVPGRQLVITSVSSANNTIEPGDQAPGSLELFAPNNIATSSALPACILVTWDVPPQLSVTFEVQRNSSAIESGATRVASTRGGLYIDTGGDPAYFRVRSVTSLWRVSGWSAWVSGIPGTAVDAVIHRYRQYIYTILAGAPQFLMDADGHLITAEFETE